MPQPSADRDLTALSKNPATVTRDTRVKWSKHVRRHFWILPVFILYFLTLSATLVHKHECLLNDWPFDEAYMIQQFHNWKSGYPIVTIQPGDFRSGFPGEKPLD